MLNPIDSIHKYPPKCQTDRSVRTEFSRLSTNTAPDLLKAIKQHSLANHELSRLPISANNQLQPDNRLGLSDVSVPGARLPIDVRIKLFYVN